MSRFKKWLIKVYFGIEIEEHPEMGTRIITGPGWGRVDIVDKEKWWTYQSNLLNPSFKSPDSLSECKKED